MELFLTKSGPRVDINKRKGLFSKMARRRGTFRSRPLDPDLVARIKGGRRSNQVRSFWIERIEEIGRAGRRRNRWRAAALRGGSPE